MKYKYYSFHGSAAFANYNLKKLTNLVVHRKISGVNILEGCKNRKRTEADS
jgi:hypothetical protein